MIPDPIETTILALVTARGAAKSICPSEVARALKPDGWQSLMTPVRQAAIRLSVAGQIDILRKGKPVGPDAVHGVIRLRLRADE
ncbi:MAG: DUF3253 domain-containing protein [Janthinobacterium lividum]